MKLRIVIDPTKEEEIVVHAHAKSRLTEELARLVERFDTNIIGYAENRAVKLEIDRIDCFSVEGGKVYAITSDGRFHVKTRLYVLEEQYSKSFIKINQSCLANVSAMTQFDTMLSCALRVTFRSGYTDYVSRRCLKSLKERMGLNK
ncbi:MAG: LytTR family transcriptional regulator DNA-binding domain-containing protein [Clostridia bacterium]|nr:LytTR family transcriptional regulator DNA-binding domain-containing protein [Clostridia bacterium]